MPEPEETIYQIHRSGGFTTQFSDEATARDLFGHWCSRYPEETVSLSKMTRIEIDQRSGTDAQQAK